MSQEFYFWVHTPEKGMSTKAHRHVNSWDFPGVQWLKLPAPKKKTKKNKKTPSSQCRAHRFNPHKMWPKRKKEYKKD